jgi:hypothetical protein
VEAGNLHKLANTPRFVLKFLRRRDATRDCHLDRQ